MADIDLATKLLDLKKKIRDKENQKLKLQTQLEVATKSLKDKYDLTPETAEEEVLKLEDKIKTKKDKIKKDIKKLEEEYELS